MNERALDSKWPHAGGVNPECVDRKFSALTTTLQSPGLYTGDRHGDYFTNWQMTNNMQTLRLIKTNFPGGDV